MLETMVMTGLALTLGLIVGGGIGYYFGIKNRPETETEKPEVETFDPEPVIVSSYWTDEAKDEC